MELGAVFEVYGDVRNPLIIKRTVSIRPAAGPLLVSSCPRVLLRVSCVFVVFQSVESGAC